MMSVARGITQFKRKEISFLFEHAIRIKQSSSFVLLRAKQQGAFGRILVINSKKVGNAPARNLLKRRIKSLFYSAKIDQKGFDWVFIARQKATTLSYVALEQKLLTYFVLP